MALPRLTAARVIDSGTCAMLCANGVATEIARVSATIPILRIWNLALVGAGALS
ncbi:hypothetical protein [Ralstonia solanacearum]|uniref:hypothetical protein n=1 Tax=Ralstonia solanacearum TaxID=305 RepID=UPI000A684133|nr:hypothetical protein [Ralstonia solanacearum]